MCFHGLANGEVTEQPTFSCSPFTNYGIPFHSTVNLNMCVNFHFRMYVFLRRGPFFALKVDT